MLQRLDMLHRISRDRNQISIVTRSKFAHVGGAPEKLRRTHSRSLYSHRRSHTIHHHVVKLLGVVPMRIHTSIGSEGHLHPSLPRAPKRFALLAAHTTFFVDLLLRQSKLRCLLQNVIVVINVHHEEGTALLRHSNTLIVRQRCVFNRVNPSLNRPLDALCAMRVRSDLTTC